MVQYHYEKSATLRRVLWLSNLGTWALVIVLVVVYTKDQAHQSGEGWNWAAFFFVLLFNPLHWLPGIMTAALSYMALTRSKNGDVI